FKNTASSSTRKSTIFSPFFIRLCCLTYRTLLAIPDRPVCKCFQAVRRDPVFAQLALCDLPRLLRCSGEHTLEFSLPNLQNLHGCPPLQKKESFYVLRSE